MKEELTVFQNTGSDPSEAGVAKSRGRMPCSGWEGWNGDSGDVEEWKTWTTSRGIEDDDAAALKAERSAWMLASYCGLDRFVPQWEIVDGLLKPH